MAAQVCVDITGNRYVILRRRDDNRLAIMVSPPGSPDHGPVVSPTLYLALTAMLTRHRAPTAPGIERAAADSDPVRRVPLPDQGL